MSKNKERPEEELLNQGEEQKMAINFLFACQSADIEQVKKMIFEDNIEYTKAIQVYIDKNPTPVFLIAKQMFEQRELNKILHQDLNHNNTPGKRPKI